MENNNAFSGNLEKSRSSYTNFTQSGFQAKTFRRDKECHYVLVKRKVQ